VTAIAVHDLRWYHADGTGFGPIDLRVETGERIAFIGHHGSGKTTLLRLLVGAATPPRGSVLIGGHPAGSGAAAELVSATVDPLALDEERTMREHLELAARDAADWREDADDLAGRLGLADRFDDPVRMFSRGMRQKLVLCMAMLPEFEVLVLDEPFEGLDARSRRGALDLLDLAHRYGATVVVATNDLDAAARSARVVAMRRGRIAAEVAPDGDLAAWITEPETPSNPAHQELE
jgi:ABC-type multidrug transport system ATPase subunit